MSGKKAYFIETKGEVFSSTICDKCGLKIINVQDGKRFWNPIPNAHHKNICRKCYDVWRHKKSEDYQRWRETHKKLEKENGIPIRRYLMKLTRKYKERT